jgi:hypothetical protein
MLLYIPRQILALNNLTESRLTATLAYLDQLISALPEIQFNRPDADLIRREFRWTVDMLRHACRRGLWVLGQAQGTEDAALRRHLAQDADRLIAEYTGIWQARNRPGGLKDSLARLERMRSDYA